MASLKNLVVGVDGSDGARRALEWATAQAGGGDLTVVHGFSPGLELWAAAAQINLDPARAEHQTLLDTTWSEPARSDSSTRVRTVLVDNNPASALVELATRESADAIVIGHQGHSRWSRHHVGDIAGRLLHRCDLPLILTNHNTKPNSMTGTVVVGLSRPTDPTNPELRWALQLAMYLNLEVHLVTLLDSMSYVNASYPDDVARIHMESRLQMDRLAEEVGASFPSVTVSNEIRDAEVSKELAAVTAERDACMVIVGAHHPGRIAGFVAGSVARTLPPLLSCPLAVVPSV